MDLLSARGVAMRARCVAVLAFISSVALLFTAITASAGLPLHAQQPAKPSSAGPPPRLTADTQAKLRKLQEDLKAAKHKRDMAACAKALKQIGDLFFAASDWRRALAYYSQLPPMLRELGDLDAELETLVNIDLACVELGDTRKGLDFIRDASFELGPSALGGAAGHLSEAVGNLNEGYVRLTLGQYEKAFQYSVRALVMAQRENDRYGDSLSALSLSVMGFASQALGDNQKALLLLSQTLAISRENGDEDTEALDLADIGYVWAKSGDKKTALDYLSQALPLAREANDGRAEGFILAFSGLTYAEMGDPRKAIDDYNQALLLFSSLNTGPLYEANGPIYEAHILYALLLAYKDDRPALAIYYGKQAIIDLQKVRENIKGMGENAQASLLASEVIQGHPITDFYRSLADLLIGQGRLPEAEQVLDLLKQQEYRDYVRGDTASTLSPPSLNPTEQQANSDFKKFSAEIVSIGEQWAQLKKIAARTAEQEQRYQQLSGQLTAANRTLNDYYARIYTLFGQNSDANKQVADVTGNVSQLKQTLAKMPNTVALFTLVWSDHLSVIVVTGSTAVAREYPIAEQDLNQKVANLQWALRTPHSDPKPPAEDLYKILIGPIQADLDQAEAKTLVWSLDGVLRYVPIAALYDGKQYLVKNYSTVTITPAFIAHLSDQPNMGGLSAVAMGISNQYQQNLPALPAVVGELDEIVNDAQVQGANGVLPGTILLNGAFTEKAMESQLGGSHNVVHIASHFVFQPGDDSQSYLLLAGKDTAGSGFRLTIADFRDDQNITLDDTDLLTLSACETGMSGSVSSNGREVDGLGTTAQLKGAKAVISSLWEVNDASTGALMADFYKRWADGGGKVTKVEALRQAQLDLLLGRLTPQSDANGRGFSAIEHEPAQQAGLADYAHPYYWAPFVLMGNWR